jgi:hypothetical protein
MDFEIGERVELKPVARGRGELYDKLIQAVRDKKVAGAYPVEVTGMTAKQLHAALSNKLKKDKTLRPRKRGDQVYLEIVKVTK